MRLFLSTLVVALAATHGLAAEGGTARGARIAPTTLAASANTRELVPPGATQVLLCRYHGLNPASTAHRLVRGRLVTNRAEVQRLASELTALPKTRGRIACPMDDGSEIAVEFSYSHSASVTVTVGLTGCRTVSN